MPSNKSNWFKFSICAKAMLPSQHLYCAIKLVSSITTYIYEFMSELTLRGQMTLLRPPLNQWKRPLSKTRNGSLPHNYRPQWYVRHVYLQLADIQSAAQARFWHLKRCNSIWHKIVMFSQGRCHLDLEAPAVPPPSRLLKFPSLWANVRLGVAVRDSRRRAKVLDSFPSILRTPQENLLGGRKLWGQLDNIDLTW
jgi:hypothetical protein